MRLIKLSGIIGSVLMTGCASVTDIQNLHSQVKLLDPQVAKLTAFVTHSKAIANAANTKAIDAEATSNRAAHKIRVVASKVDALFIRCRLPP